MDKQWYDKKVEAEKLSQGLAKTRSSIFGHIAKFFVGKRSVDDEFLDQLEDVLVTADAGVKTTLYLVDELRNRVKTKPYKDQDELMSHLHDLVAQLLTTGEGKNADPEWLLKRTKENQPLVILVVGVNGVGKTTTIGKLATFLKEHGLSVVMGAADTFRAAATEQLTIWSERAGVRIVKHEAGADPAAVAFDTVQSAIAKNDHVVLIDTAGRLHNKLHLMDELNKIQRSIQKVLPGAPHEVWLVLDASTGQNALVQAKEFSKVVSVSGIILTKLDGTAKGGIVLSIANELKTPVRFIGMGEQKQDLRPFSPAIFADALFEGIKTS